MSWASIIMATKATAASLTDTLAAIGERMPGLTQLTVSAGGLTATIGPMSLATSQAPPLGKCPTCGRGP